MLLKELRLQLGLTQTELAKELGCSVSSICKYENGANTPDSFVSKVESKFNVTIVKSPSQEDILRDENKKLLMKFDGIVSKINFALNLPKYYYLTAVSVCAGRRLSAYLKKQESIVVDVSCFDSMDKAKKALDKYIKDFLAEGYTIIEENSFDDWISVTLHKGNDIEQFEINCRQINHDVCNEVYYD